MKAVTRGLVFAVLATAFGLYGTLWAQATPLIPETSLIASTSLSPDGKRIILTIQNLRSNALTALVYEAAGQMTSTTGQKAPVLNVAYRDPAINGNDHPIPANQSGSLAVAVFPPAIVTVKAAIWSDGASFGDAAYIHKLLHRRTLLRDRLNSAMSILLAARNERTSLPAVIASVSSAQAKLAQSDEIEEKSAFTFVESAVKNRLSDPPRKRSNGTVLTDRETIDELMNDFQTNVDRLTPYL